MEIPDINLYKFSYERLSHIDWRAIITNPNAQSYSIKFQCPGNFNENEVNHGIFKAFCDPKEIKNFAIEVDSEVIKDKEPEVIVKPIEIKEEIDKLEDNTVVFES